MPCDGIAVLLAQTSSIKAALATLGEIECTKSTFLEAQDKVTFDLEIFNQTEPIFIKIVVQRNGRITAITQNGTFEGGVDALKKLIIQLKANNVDISNETFESHKHDEVAPQLAYNQAMF